MKHTWRRSIVDHAASNSLECEQVYLEDFVELCQLDEESSKPAEVDVEVVAV